MTRVHGDIELLVQHLRPGDKSFPAMVRPLKLLQGQSLKVEKILMGLEKSRPVRTPGELEVQKIGILSRIQGKIIEHL